MTKVSFSKPQGPDQGFAWVVAFACFLINFLMAGLARSAGVLYVALIDLYGASRETATMPFSIRVSVRNLSGPIVGLLGQRYGIRAVTISGGVFAAVGGILCYFAPDIVWITVFWGVIHGIGFGLSTVIHMVIINQYFEKYRATALGIGYSGDCIGTFILPVIIDALLYDYGVREAFLMIGGMVLNVIPLAMLLKSPPWLKRPPKSIESNNENKIPFYENKGFTDSQTLSKDHSCDDCGDRYTIESTQPAVPIYAEAIKSVTCSMDSLKTKLDSDLVVAEECNSKLECRCNVERRCCDQVSSSVDTKCLKDGKLNDNLITEGDVASSVSNLSITDLKVVAEHKTVVSDIDNLSMLKKTDGVTEIVMESRDLNHGNIVKTTITEHGGTGCDTVLKIRTLSESRRLGMSCESRSSPFKEAHGNSCRSCSEPAPIGVCQEVKFRKGNVEVIQNPVSSSIIISYDNDSNAKEENASTSVPPTDLMFNDSVPLAEETETIRAVLLNAAKLNIKPMFVLISITGAVYAYLFIAVMTVIIDFGVDKGVDPERGKYFIIIFSAADLVGRLGFGVVIDRKWAPMKHYVAVTVGGMGFVVSIIPFVSGFLSLMAGMCAFGLIQGGVAIIFPILVAEYMEKKEESIAMGCLNFYGGVLMLSMAPMIGFFRDKYGTYDNMFHLVGLCCLAVGLAWSFEPLILRCQNRSKSKPISAYNKEECHE